MDLKQAQTEALILANTRKASHVIVKVGNNYNVYPLKMYVGEVIEVVEPAKTEVKPIEIQNKPVEIVPENKPKKVNVSKKA